MGLSKTSIKTIFVLCLLALFGTITVALYDWLNPKYSKPDRIAKIELFETDVSLPHGNLWLSDGTIWYVWGADTAAIRYWQLNDEVAVLPAGVRLIKGHAINVCMIVNKRSGKFTNDVIAWRMQ